MNSREMNILIYIPIQNYLTNLLYAAENTKSQHFVL